MLCSHLPVLPWGCLRKTHQEKCTKVCNKEIRESNKRGKKQTNKTPNLRSCPQKEARKKSVLKIPTCSLCLLPLRLQDNFCCPRTLIYNPVSCKNYTLKSLLNEILVRSRDSTSSWKHMVYYSSTFSFHHQWLSDDNSTGCTRSAHAAAEASAMPGHPWQTHQPTSQTLNRLKKVLILQKCSFSKNNILLSFSSYTEGQVNLSTHILSLCQNATFTTPKLISSRKPSAN